MCTQSLRMTIFLRRIDRIVITSYEIKLKCHSAFKYSAFEMRFSKLFRVRHKIFSIVYVLLIYYKTQNKLHQQLFHFQLHRWNIFAYLIYRCTRWMYNLWKCSKLYKKWKCQNLQNFVVHSGNILESEIRREKKTSFWCSQTIWCSATCFNDGYMNFDYNNFSFDSYAKKFTLHSVHWEHKSISSRHTHTIS